MADEITIRPKSESTPASTGADSQTAKSGQTQLINLCALGLGVCFFLPWAQILGVRLSGFDLQKMGDEQRLLWAIPIFCAITIIAGFAKQNQKDVAQIAGASPFVVGVYWYLKMKDDFFHVLVFGAFLSLAFGAALLILPRKAK
jgi:hypothetical protein